MTRRQNRRQRSRRLLAMTLLCGGIAPAAAMELVQTGDLTVRWDNTFKYSIGKRLQGPNPALLANPNGDDGERAFAKGAVVTNRVDWLSELDARKGDWGLRIGVAGWHDQAYRGTNDHDSPATFNPVSVPPGRFPGDTRDLMGRRLELLDAFVSGKFQLGEMGASVRAGRHTVLWGESLLLPTNGIAAAQAPLDAIKATSVPGSLARELFMPVNQLSGQLQLRDGLTLAAYYQLEWRKTRIPPVVSFLSPSDVADAGGERLFAGPGASFYRAADARPRDRGQFGLSLRWTPVGSEVDYGFYALRYHDKTPQAVLAPGAGVGPGAPADKAGEYYLNYARDINVFGASFSTNVGGANVAGEASIRDNAPLVSTPGARLPGTATAPWEPLYAVGRTAHAQVSMLSLFRKSPLWDSASLALEVGWNRRLSVERNPAALDATRSRDAWAGAVSFTPTYFQVAPGLDLTLPLSLSWGLSGSSSAVGGFAPRRGGTASIGLEGTYDVVWKFGIRLNEFIGSPTNQALTDRRFVVAHVRRTF